MDDNYAYLAKKYRRLKIFTAALAAVLAVMLYLSYDYTVFKLLIAGNYIFTDTLDEVYTAALGEGNVKGYLQDFDRVVISVVTERLRAVGGDRYTYLYTPYGYKASKAAEKEDAALTEISEIDAENVYLRIPNMSGNSRRYVLSNADRLEGYKNLVIDLRGNYGGMLHDYYMMARLFLDDGATIGYENTRLPVFTRHVRSRGERRLNYERITILQDGSTASSAEGFIMALKQNLDNVELVGERTFGKGIGQVTIPLTGGYAVKATVMLIGTPDGGSIHGVGIEPTQGDGSSVLTKQ